MLSPTRKHYLLLDKRCRRYSAPVDIRYDVTRPYQSEESEDDTRSKVSVIDLTSLFEGQSGSDSSLELDTTISRCVSPRLEPSSPPGCYECINKEEESSPICIALSSKCVWKAVVLSQIMSLCVSLVDLTNERMNQLETPVLINTQNLPHYLLLGLVFTPQLAMREGGRGVLHVLRHSGLRYILLAWLHVAGTSLIVSSLKHDTYIGNQMIDCVASSLSLVVAFVCLDVEFMKSHVLGFTIAFVGAIGLCMANTNQSSDEDDVTWGDVLRFGSGLFIAFNSLAQELIVKSIDTVEYLGMIGLIAGLFSIVQAIIFQWHTAVPFSCDVLCPLATFAFVQFLFSWLSPKVLREVGATGLHLALISSTFYYRALRWAIYGSSFQQLFFYSYLLVLCGSLIFALKRTTIGKHYFYPVKVTIGN